MRPRTLRMWAVIGILLMMAALIAGFTTGTAKRYQELDQAIQIMAHVKLRFVEPVSAADLFRAYLRTGTIDGMLASLHDPYTRFLPPAEYRELKVQTDGSFGGIGVILSYNEKDKSILIMKALNGSPGEKAGLRRGDRLVEIDGRAAKGMSVEEAVASIRGPIGSTVRLAVSRGEGESARVVTVTIVRANIKLPSVEWEFLDDPVAGRVALIALAQFSERTPEELDEALRAVDENRARGIILDLRYNPGGLLESAIGVASRFLDGGVVMYMLKRGGDRQPFPVEPQPRQRHYPLVVLVNQWSASASEIVAGALKDRGVATLVGARTFGKGLVQEIVPVNRGAAVSITVARYLTAGGKAINKIGIEPHVKVDIPGIMDRAMKDGKFDELLRLERQQKERAVEVIRTLVNQPLAAAS